MKKIVRIGHSANTGNVYCKITFENKKLSISGVEGPKHNGNCIGGWGQIETSMDENYISSLNLAPGWNKTILKKFIAIWRKWHLNDMRAGCEHQRHSFDSEKELTLIDYSWSDVFHTMRTKATKGKLTTEEYEKFKTISADVTINTIGINSPKYKTEGIKKLLKSGMIKESKKETKKAHWVNEKEHPEGLLCKPCPVCGYKYGTAWLHEDVPEDVIDFLSSLPETDKTPAWI